MIDRDMKSPWGNEPYPEDLMVGTVPITRPNKIVYPDSAIRKGDAARYYLDVAEHMMPHVGNRLISTVRCPRGVGESCFYRKHPQAEHEGIGIMSVHEISGGIDDYFYLKNVAGLLSEIQKDTLEFHLWGSSVEDLEHPNMVVFDLDPDAELELEKTRQGVRDLKSVLDALPLKTFLKTSGGKGYHVVAPLRPTGTWEQTHVFAKQVAQLMEARWPDRYTSNSRKKERHGRTFVDWLRNARGATSVSPYSLRARAGVTVSMPISWDELDEIAPNQITLAGALDRLKREDPWAEYFETVQELTPGAYDLLRSSE